MSSASPSLRVGSRVTELAGGQFAVPAGFTVRTTRGHRTLWRIDRPVWRVVRVRLHATGGDVLLAPFRG